MIVDGILCATWEPHGNHMGTTWEPHGNHVSNKTISPNTYTDVAWWDRNRHEDLFTY